MHCICPCKLTIASLGRLHGAVLKELSQVDETGGSAGIPIHVEVRLLDVVHRHPVSVAMDDAPVDKDYERVVCCLHAHGDWHTAAEVESLRAFLWPPAAAPCIEHQSVLIPSRVDVEDDVAAVVFQVHRGPAVIGSDVGHFDSISDAEVHNANLSTLSHCCSLTRATWEE